MVGKTAMRHKEIAPRNFPRTNFQMGIGLMSNSSNVPTLRSSEKLFIVIAGTRKIKIQGASKKKIS